MRLRSLVVLATVTVASALVAAACDDSSSSGSNNGFDAGPGSGFDAASPESDAAVVDSASPDTSAPDAADAADAAVIVTTMPFSTGLDPASVPLADTQIDPHWTVKDSAGTVLTPYVQTEALGYAGYWMPPSATSKFISPFIDTVDPTGTGTFTYTTSFAVGADVDLDGEFLAVQYASDNDMMAIAVNGTPLLDVAPGSYSAFTSRATSVVHGTNTISFTVNNAGGPTGLRVELALVKE